LGRGLGDLLKQSNGAETPPSETCTATLSAGVRTLLGHNAPPESNAEQSIVASSPTTERVPLSHLRWSLFAGDVVLCALVALVMTRRDIHLNAAQVALCIGGIAMGAWFACLALRCR